MTRRVSCRPCRAHWHRLGQMLSTFKTVSVYSSKILGLFPAFTVPLHCNPVPVLLESLDTRHDPVCRIRVLQYYLNGHPAHRLRYCLASRPYNSLRCCSSAAYGCAGGVSRGMASSSCCKATQNRQSRSVSLFCLLPIPHHRERLLQTWLCILPQLQLQRLRVPSLSTSLNLAWECRQITAPVQARLPASFSASP